MTSMVAHKRPKPGVYLSPFLFDGRPAYYLVDWHGVRSDIRVVGETESEEEVVAELRASAGPNPSRASDRRRSDQPPLFLL